jgi:ribosomal-protein-alanine N-acetyltransferase
MALPTTTEVLHMAYVKVLSTPRLTLRVPQTGDEAALFELHSDPTVMRYLNEPPWTDPARAVQKINDNAGAFERQEYFRFAIVLNETGWVIGNCSLFALNKQNRRAEIGYCLNSAYWRRGYMHEALQALLDYAFGEHGLHRLEADIDPRNTASAGILERLGFVREGYLRERWFVGGEVCDTELYGLLARDWMAART